MPQEGCREWKSSVRGDWQSDAFTMYVRATREEEGEVSKVLASNAAAREIQPGQGSKWGGGRVRNNDECRFFGGGTGGTAFIMAW